MSFKPGFKSRTLLGDFSLSSKLNQVSFPGTTDMHEVTTQADNGVKRFIPGQSTSTATLTGFADPDAVTDSVAWTTAQPLTFGQEGIAHSSPVMMVDALKSSLEVGSPVGGVVSFDLGAQTDGYTNLGVSLHDLTAETADSSSAAYDGGAASTAGGYAHLHVTAFSGFSGVVVTVEGSANGTTGWATLGTFATVAAVTGERIALAASMHRYLRATWDVTGTGSITFAVAAARL